MKTTVAFPGLGIEEFSMSRVAFTVFGKDIYWYGVIIMLGVVAAFIHAMARSREEGIKTDDVFDLTIWIVLFGILGGRLYYVATTWGNYHSFIDVIAIWDGGMAIYGGVIAGGITAVVVSKIKHINALKVTDMAAPGVMLAQAMGRWGNFVNGEAFGYAVKPESPLYPFRMGVVSEFAPAPMQYYHPTFLYESLWNLIGFILISVFYRKKKFNGQILLSYLTWYGFGRMFIEGLRTDSLYVGPIRISQLVGGLCFVVGASLLIAGLVLAHKKRLPAFMKVQWADRKPAVCPEAGPEQSGETGKNPDTEPDDGDYEPCFGGVGTVGGGDSPEKRESQPTETPASDTEESGGNSATDREEGDQ